MHRAHRLGEPLHVGDLSVGAARRRSRASRRARRGRCRAGSPAFANASRPALDRVGKCPPSVGRERPRKELGPIPATVTRPFPLRHRARPSRSVPAPWRTCAPTSSASAEAEREHDQRQARAAGRARRAPPNRRARAGGWGHAIHRLSHVGVSCSARRADGTRPADRAPGPSPSPGEIIIPAAYRSVGTRLRGRRAGGRRGTRRASPASSRLSPTAAATRDRMIRDTMTLVSHFVPRSPDRLTLAFGQGSLGRQLHGRSAGRRFR